MSVGHCKTVAASCKLQPSDAGWKGSSRVSRLAVEVDQLFERLPEALVCVEQWTALLLQVSTSRIRDDEYDTTAAECARRLRQFNENSGRGVTVAVFWDCATDKKTHCPLINTLQQNTEQRARGRQLCDLKNTLLSANPTLIRYDRHTAGASEGILVWYGKPGHLEYNSWGIRGVVAEPRILEI